MISYVHVLRRNLKLSFSVSLLFVTSCLLLVMLFAGLIHLMKEISLGIFFLGFCPLLYEVFWLSRTHHKNIYINRIKTWWRPEYAYFFIVVFLGFFFFTQYRIDFGAGDFWTAWYDQFCYLFFNNCWADSGYKNYASAYAMINNGFCCYIATVLKNPGTQIYIFSVFLLAITALFPLVSLINWKHISVVGNTLIIFFILLSKLSCMDYWVTNSVLGIGLFFWLIRGLYTKHRCIFFRNNLMLATAEFLALFLIQEPMSFLHVPQDTLLGCFSLGIFILFALEFCLTSRLEQKKYIFIPMLLVLPLIKPTGILPAMLLSIGISTFLIFRQIRTDRTHFRMSSWKSRKSAINSYLIIALICITPFLANWGWNAYARYAKLQYQHSFSSVKESFLGQLKNGVSPAEKKAWLAKIKGMGYYSHRINEKKNVVITKAEQWLAWIIIKNEWNFDKTFYEKGVSHSANQVLVIGCILFLFSIIFWGMLDFRVAYFFLIVMGTAIFIFIMFCQYYFAPMFTNVPGLFRYLYPGVIMTWGVCFCGAFFVLKNKNIWEGVAATILLLYTFWPLLLSPVNFDLPRMSPQAGSCLPYVVMANSSANSRYIFYCADPWRDGAIHLLMQRRGFLPLNNNVLWHLSSPLPKDIVMFLSERVGPSVFKIKGNLESPGIYFAQKRADNSLEFRKIYDNQDAIALLNHTYSLKTPYSLAEKQEVELDINGSFRDDPYHEISDFWYIDNISSKHEYLKLWWGNNALSIKTQKNSVLIASKKKNFFFEKDVFRIQGTLLGKAKISFLCHIYKKDKEKYIYRKAFEVTPEIIAFAKDKFSFSAIINCSSIGKEVDSEYITILIRVHPDSQCMISNLHLFQKVSGYINIERILNP